MPYVNIKITNENVTNEKRKILIEGVTKLLSEQLDKNPNTTVVTIDEYSTDNWGISGKQVTEIRSNNKKGK